MEQFPLPQRSHRPPVHLRQDPLWLQQQVLEEQVELWWFGEPGLSLLCYCSSVGLVLGLGLGGVGLLSTASSAVGSSAVWRLGVGSTLCLLALVVLLKQLLSSAVQDMGCVRSRRRVELLRSGGYADPFLLLFTGLAMVVCGAMLLGLNWSDMLLSGVVLLSSGGAVVMSVAVYRMVIYIKDWRRRSGRRRRRGRRRRMRVYTVTGQRTQPWRDSASSQASLI
ncbi:transmembrane protein 125 [Chanos chanos]|uniref:Transmembrane protein 125 n=1 Tax=Chanos chanos TaxID=29144 RepID=A0A6J2VEL5_CHACN|nr:transmembrane protein 125-like [Chanos chanos]